MEKFAQLQRLKNNYELYVYQLVARVLPCQICKPRCFLRPLRIFQNHFLMTKARQKACLKSV